MVETVTHFLVKNDVQYKNCDMMTTTKKGWNGEKSNLIQEGILSQHFLDDNVSDMQ